MKVKDMIVEKTSTEYDYTIMHVLKMESTEVTCAWIGDNAIPQIKIFDIEELEIFVED